MAVAEALSFCLVSTFYPPFGFGGDGVHVQRLAGALAASGHRVRVVHAPQAYRLLGGEAAPVESVEHEGIEVVAVPAGRPATIGTYLTGQPLGYGRQLAQLVEGFDVVHFHNPSLLGGPGALRLGDGVRLYTTHEHWLVCPTHVLFRNNREICTRRTCVSCTIRHHRPPQPWRATAMLERAVDHLDALLCPSRFTADLHRRHFPRARIEVLPLPVPLAEAIPTRPADPPMFLYAGRLEPIKGIDRLVAAFPAVRGADLVVAGDGSLAPALAEAARRNPRIRLVGRRTPAEVLELCRQAAAVVVPSAGYETFGGIAVEAMSVATPVAVRALGPLPELVEEGGGVTFDSDESMVAVLQDLVDRPELRAALAAEATEIAATRFSEGRFLARYFAIIAERAAAGGRHDIGRRARLAEASVAEEPGA